MSHLIYNYANFALKDIGQCLFTWVKNVLNIIGTHLQTSNYIFLFALVTFDWYQAAVLLMPPYLKLYDYKSSSSKIKLW